jgi:multifunctional 2-oxoglutarate metabolism enzyme
VLWEAQFGDFANGAQSVIDEFISSGEAKWGQRSDVTLLLPHGYEGQGPDHSSGRIERFLQLFADNNMWVVYPTTPANHFHMLRKQALGNITRPLIVFTPKSLLRHRLAVSAVEDFTSGTFQPVIDDATVTDRAAIRRVLLSTGKVYYDLLQYRDKAARSDVAIVRVEQLAPIPVAAIESALAGYPNASEFIWVQDEPLNQGAWPFVALNLPGQLPGLALQVRARQAASAPATGSGKRHEAEQTALVESAFA